MGGSKSDMRIRSPCALWQHGAPAISAQEMLHRELAKGWKRVGSSAHQVALEENILTTYRPLFHDPHVFPHMAEMHAAA